MANTVGDGAAVEPIRMPNMPKYKPQVDADDPDTYMMLVPAANINTQLPIIQIACTGLAILFAVAALAKDEMSDGDIVFSTGAAEVDYDCGWNSYRLNINGYSETYKYAGQYCSNNDEIIDEEFCADSVRNGALWLGCNLVGVLCLIVSIPIILSKQCGGKDSIAFYISGTIGLSLFCFSSFWWWTQDRCEDVEEYDTVFTEADFDTSPGPSLYLMW
eukprot:CAMPEP_0202708312 /NCGR_PEP_ID=MMETSP1385-20130828/20538_1 /ASSEMBLY_ACC=CAM_ASM_000861 /TAXON_ID=933848 /ORGANISM="Elphidium margaritaceum" /LENGTH=216 /DNA_ID=CAMNT_0049367251 /DNA_START=37 /DNA_END=684 /DNA_ORIENTATION=-